MGEEKKIPLVLDAYAKNQLDLSDVNRVLELSSIKEFFDKYDYVNAWNDDYYRKYKELSRNAEKEVRLFFQSITENAIVPIYNVCKVIFWDEFWKYFYIYKVYDKISAEHFKEIADGLRIPPNELLKNKNLVEKFDTQITEMLKNPEYGARFIVDYYMRKDNGKTKCYFPKSLTKEDKYNIIKAYINGDIVNINILDLIINGKQFKLFCEEGEIDRELYEMISGSVRYKEIPSLIKNKYAYANSNEILREMQDMFSNQGLDCNSNASSVFLSPCMSFISIEMNLFSTLCRLSYFSFTFVSNCFCPSCHNSD